MKTRSAEHTQNFAQLCVSPRVLRFEELDFAFARARMRRVRRAQIPRWRGLISTLPALLIGFALFAAPSSARAQQPSATEDQVKAAFLFNFAKLSEWPRRALPDGPSPIVIGVSGADEDFVGVLKAIVAGKMNGTHPFVVKAVSSEEEMKSCQMIFFRASEKKHASLEDLARASVLLVGEDQSFLPQGGMINLVRDHGKIRFEVNSENLETSKVAVNAKILSLAKAGDTAPASNTPSATAGGRPLVQSPPPAYPDVAQQMNLSGTARVQAVVSPNGKVKEVTVLGGHPLLAAALADAVRQWKYQPAPKETVETVSFTFAPH
jgi:TonB family protein